jgi:hypothetical protein
MAVIQGVILDSKADGTLTGLRANLAQSQLCSDSINYAD